MNDYEERQEAKRERLRKAAARRREESAQLYSTGKQMFEAIPLGQPILIGHHSERSDRSYRGRANNKLDKSWKLLKEAEELESRADNIGSGGISSMDPDAISKLDDKLTKLQEAHALMVERNKEARALGQQKPYPSWQLQNSSANIRRIQDRITGLQHQQTLAPHWKDGEGWTMREDIAEHRILFTFEQIPEEKIRGILKARGFRWSSTRKAWVRMLNGNGRFAAEQVAKFLFG